MEKINTEYKDKLEILRLVYLEKSRYANWDKFRFASRLL